MDSTVTHFSEAPDWRTLVLSPRGERPPSMPDTPKSDLDTFTTFYERWADFVLRSVRRLGVRGTSVEDVAQEIFLVVHRRLPEFDASKGSERAWLFGITRNVVMHHGRSLRRRREVFDVEGERAVSHVHEDAERNEVVAFVDGVLAGLDEDKRLVFILSELEEMTAPEISQALDIPVNTVYSRVRLARREIEAALSAHAGLRGVKQS